LSWYLKKKHKDAHRHLRDHAGGEESARTDDQ